MNKILIPDLITKDKISYMNSEGSIIEEAYHNDLSKNKNSNRILTVKFIINSNELKSEYNKSELKIKKLVEIFEVYSDFMVT
jgi:hypothetical protein